MLDLLSSLAKDRGDMDSLGNLTSHQELGRAPGSYLLEILPPCQDLGEVWIFLPTAIPLVGHHQQPPFFQGLGSQSTRHDLSHSSYHLFCCPPVIDWESRAASRGSMHCGHYNSATITKVTAAIALGEREVSATSSSIELYEELKATSAA